jgi:hypothetical protein
MRPRFFACLLALSVLLGQRIASAQNVILVPDSGGSTNLSERILALDPVTGAVINANFITEGSVNRMQTPIEAIGSGLSTILVSDQLANSIFEYDLSGNYVRTLLNSTAGLNNIRGIAVRNNILYVTNAGGANPGSILQFDVATGTPIGTGIFADLINSGPLTAGASPFDVYVRAGDILVSDAEGDDILSYGFDGAYLGKLVDGNNTTIGSFPQQITPLSNGNEMVSGFSLPTGFVEFNNSGSVTTYANGTGNRGLIELGNGDMLYTAGTQIRTFNRGTNVHTTLLDDVATSASFRYANLVNLTAAIPEPSPLMLVLAGGLVGQRFLRRRSLGATSAQK